MLHGENVQPNETSLKTTERRQRGASFITRASIQNLCMNGCSRDKSLFIGIIITLRKRLDLETVWLFWFVCFLRVCLHLCATMNSLLADTLKPWMFYFVVIMGWNKKKKEKKEYIKIVFFVHLQRIYLILPLITWLRGRREINALKVLLHTFMHTWAPSYNRTLPSIVTK